MQREEWKYRKKYTSSKYSPGSQHFINLMCGIFLFNNPKCLSLQGSCTGSLSAHANFFRPQYSFAGSSVANRTVFFFLSLGLASFIWCPLALMLEDRVYNFYHFFSKTFFNLLASVMYHLSSLSLFHADKSQPAQLSLQMHSGGSNAFSLVGILTEDFAANLCLCVCVCRYICLYIKYIFLYTLYIKYMKV